MIPLQGTAEIRHVLRNGEEEYASCAVVAIAEDGDLLIVPGWMANLAPRWVSAIGATVCSFTPAPNHVTAAPGWWVRVTSHDENADTVDAHLLPVIAWRMGEEPAPVVLDGVSYSDRWEGVVEDPARAISDYFDAIIFDPDHRPEAPEVLEDEVRGLTEMRRKRSERKVEATEPGTREGST